MTKRITLGVLAHVDAGKTTLSEAILFRSGVLRAAGRVDHGSTALDTHDLERRRGITIFAAEAVFPWGDTEFTLLDTPGHVDFSAEMERVLPVLDCAVLVVSGADGVQAHTETLWRLLERYGVPCVLFVTKMDLAAANRAQVFAELRSRFGEQVFDFSRRPPDEELAMCSEEALDRFMDAGALSDTNVAALVGQRALFPCYFGSGLRAEGVEALLDGLSRFLPAPEYPEATGGRVFKITHDSQGRRLTHVKLTGGALRVRDELSYLTSDGETVTEKLTALRLCEGAKTVTAERAEAGQVCVLSGLTRTFAGQGLGFEPDAPPPVLEPALSYQLILPPGLDDKTALPKLRMLEEEDPLLHFVWLERTREMRVQLMGQVQIQVLQSLIAERFGWEVEIGHGHIQYKETVAAPVRGVGHFEPLRHYAEVHLLIEPLEPGRGVELETDCPTDALDLNWQRLILTHLAEKQHLGVLTGSPLTDVRITLLAGRAHLKHTEGGDFRQATYRALRQGLMKAESVLLEPQYAFRLEVPLALTGRAISDLRSMHAVFQSRATETSTVLEGSAPVACMREYVTTVAAYTGGRGSLSCRMAGYAPCHNTEEVVAALGYDPERDLENTPDSVFCAHGAGVAVRWDKVDDMCHLELGRKTESAPVQPRLRMGNLSVDEKELEAIMEREFGPIRRPMYTKAAAALSRDTEVKLRARRETVVVDGYNVIFAWDELKAIAAQSLDSARQRLGEILVNYHGFTGSEVVLVFDGYAVKGNPGEKTPFHGIRVVYTKENESADLYIERLLHEIGKNHTVRVVTSDNLIRLSAFGSGILRTGAREFGSEMDWVMAQIGAVLQKSSTGSHTTTVRDALGGKT